MGMCQQQEQQQDETTTWGYCKDLLPSLLYSMTKHPTNPRIQAKAFAAITSLCLGNRERLAELSKANGIATLTTALQTQWENKNDQHEAISNLSVVLRAIAELDN